MLTQKRRRKSRKRREWFASLFLATLLLTAFWLLAAVVTLTAGRQTPSRLLFGSTPQPAMKDAPQPAQQARAPQRATIPVTLPEFASITLRGQSQSPVTLSASAQKEYGHSLVLPGEEGQQAQRQTQELPQPIQKRPSNRGWQTRGIHNRDTPIPLRRRKKLAPLEIKEQDEKPAHEQQKVDIDAILDWMRLTPGELPAGIRRHMDHTQGNLTARAQLGQYELYLMARVPLKEIHIVLADEQTTYYLVDRSFQKEGRAFRVGTARRTSGMITSIFSEERAASHTEAALFYDIFLHWWEREKLRLND